MNRVDKWTKNSPNSLFSGLIKLNFSTTTLLAPSIIGHNMHFANSNLLLVAHSLHANIHLETLKTMDALQLFNHELVSYVNLLN